MEGSKGSLDTWSRRSIMAASGSLGIASLAGCLSGDEEPPGNDDGSDDEPSGEEITEEEDNGSEADDRPSQPDFVVEADEYFGRIEPDFEEGVAVIGLRDEYLADDEEPDELIVYNEGEEIETINLWKDETTAVPIAAWASQSRVNGTAEYPPIIGEVQLVVENEFGDELATSEWLIEQDIEVTDIGLVADRDLGGDLQDQDMYIEFKVDGVGYISGGRSWMETHGFDWEFGKTKSGEVNPPVQNSGTYGGTLMLADGLSVVVISRGVWSAHLSWEDPPEEYCLPDGDGVLELDVIDDEDISVPLRITTNGQMEENEKGNYFCPNTQIELTSSTS